ncbi:MAG: hypothetical protein OYH76_12550 [Defluviicoccus sp.]|nr:hypothetical protein [Defluviicoccus sp.]MDE0276718.1 hypothetical protein [Defluviicoccus sp.]
MRIRARHHLPTARKWVSVDFHPSEARAFADFLRESIASAPRPGGPDLFAHDVLYRLETALEHVAGDGPPPSGEKLREG